MKPTNQQQPPMSISDEALDQLVAGSLSQDDYRRLLLALESEPARWRDCALAFLCEQALETDFKSIASADVDWDAPPTLSRTNSLTQSAVPLASSQLTSTKPAASPSSMACERWGTTAGKWLAMAGLLLISFSGGWVSHNVGERNSQVSVPNELSNSKLGKRSVIDHLQLPQFSLSEPLSTARLVGSTPTTNQAEQSETTITPQSTAETNTVDMNSVRFVSEQLVPIDRQVPAELRELERLGHVRIETLDAIMPINLDDGRSAIVPVQQFRIKPILFSF